jgi:hypothetical protein
MHSPNTAGQIAGGIAWIRKHLGTTAVSQLLEENPRRILLGELP